MIVYIMFVTIVWNHIRINMGNTLEALKIERDVLREQTQGKDISCWKFWQDKQDRELIRKLDRICEINNMLIGARLQTETHKNEMS